MAPASLRLSRRAALGLAATGVAGAAALGWEVSRGAPAAGVEPATAPAWPPPADSGRALAAQLLRRAGFGYTSDQLTAAASLAYDDLVDEVVAQAAEPLPPVQDPSNHGEVVSAWLAHMVSTGAQFPERMTLFWHGLLTSDFRGAGRRPLVRQQNALYRDLGRGDLRTLLNAVTHDPLMMAYLNLDSSTARAPNENYARELMELFTLGPGNYTETDVREGARALSGLRVVLLDARGVRIREPRYDRANPAAYAAATAAVVAGGARFTGVLVPRLHDSGAKSFLGRTGTLGPEDVIDIILAQPACAPFLVTRAMTRFATPAPSPADVSSIATAFRTGGYDIAAMMRAIFRSASFRSAASYRALVRSPVDCGVAAMRALQRPELVPVALRAAAAMDQVLYDPPNVGGWPANGGWLSSGSLLARVNLAAAAVAAGHPLPPIAAATHDQLDGSLSAATAGRVAATGAGDAWYALLASPEFQLK